MEQILSAYYEDNARKLRGTVDKILLNFGGLSDKDRDDFYSLANEVFLDVMNRYDNSQPFDVFLYSCLSNRIKTEITERNREKRRADRYAISIDTPVNDGESTIGDLIPDNCNVEKEIFEEKEEGYSRRMMLYLSKLSNLQREVLRLDADGYRPHEIKEKLHMTEKQYTDCCTAIHSYRNVSVLF